MRKPLSHILRMSMLPLLLTITVVANAVCPSVVVKAVDQMEQPSEGKIESLIEIEREYKSEDEAPMTTECQIVEGLYEKAAMNHNDNEEDRQGMRVASDDLYGTYPYESIEEKSTPSVVEDNPLNEKFSFKSLILPGGLIAAGVIGLESGLFEGRGDNDTEVSEKEGTNFEDIAQYVPAAAYLGLGLIPGIQHKHSFVERSMAAVTAYGMMFLITKPVKHWVHERRPDLTSDDSFPSGHTATAFTGAELMRLEYGTGIGLGAYALATTVAVLRIHHNRHWFNDVVAGAGVGILCARASYWLLPLERKLFGIKNPKVGVAAFPICNPQNRQFALGCCINF